MSLFVREKPFYRAFISLTLIIGLQNLITFGVNLSDNLMIGGYSEAALSGVALANQIQFLLQMLVMGTCEGVVILSARAWGAGQIQTVKQAAAIGMWIAMLLSVLMWAVVFFAPHAVLSVFTGDEAVIAEGARYLRIICFSYLFFAATSILLAMLRSVETVKIGFVVSLSTLIINICLNYVLIYGKWGFPELGIRGSAIATLSARMLETLIVIGFVKRFDDKILLRFRELLRINQPLLRQYLRIGSPILMSNTIWGAAMAAQTAILGHMGAAAIAANSIATTVFQIVTVITYASASATSVVIGKTIGQGRMEKVKPYAKTLQLLYVAIGLVTSVLLFVSKGYVLQFYSISGEAKELALRFMTVLAVTVIGTAYQMPALTGIVRSGGDTKFVLYNDTIFMWLVVLPSSALAAFVWNLPPLAVFICLKSDQILKCFVALVKVNRFRWIRSFERAA
ncbi:MATE family efflux transporter [Paenibacillus yonginensis]|uniref:MATE family efflux transporter n=1 Tax=Paenibacillus yonginensis TaxID=1462996 RepID=A0A1B1MVU4_9BACL|nr:MATE family efflux transporter [Paenibacillus yonginensis]ANS73289.1 MATE family efflux transporter [Paenibacillus yonginensis]